LFLYLQVKTFSERQGIVFGSRRTETVASIKEIISSESGEGSSGVADMLSKMTRGQVDILASCIWNFAKEHHQIILSISIDLAESLGFKRTAEFIRVVKFVVNYVQQVVNELEEKYQRDLHSAKTEQGADFNIEQFNNEYHIQGKRIQHFITAVLTNYNTPSAMAYLKAAFLRVWTVAASENGGNVAEGADSSPQVETDVTDQGADCNPKVETMVTDQGTESNLHVETVVTGQGTDDSSQLFYKKHRDFKNYGNLLIDEIYMIAQEVSGLSLHAGNARLFRDGMVAFVTVTDPHIEPVTVIISSNINEGTVTASLVL
jgi:hypothetical protein